MNNQYFVKTSDGIVDITQVHFISEKLLTLDGETIKKIRIFLKGDDESYLSLTGKEAEVFLGFIPISMDISRANFD